MVPVTAHTKRITIAMCSFLAIQLALSTSTEQKPSPTSTDTMCCYTTTTPFCGF
ncbi:hypothetical protein PR001_g20483 [Phytophthora rubi]|uniref:RxLR effector protein n=1 Tax=Phytophthora rubi TaxID=129364 RepID=A0A6A3JPP9_9STRA|nr:hypothetical protein PR001_g20483 [Phytophthora rubi]